MTTLTVPIVQAFIAEGDGGNPAGVVLDADRFNSAEKQAIAAQLGLSETAFVSGSELADYRLDFYTPTRQIADCGHATVATFSYLVQLGRLTRPESSKEIVDGRREIYLRGDMAFMEQSAPRYEELPSDSAEALLRILALRPDDLMAGKRPTIVNTGVNFIMLPLSGVSAVKAITPDFDALAALSDQFDAIGVYAFSLDTEEAGHDAGIRMFAPAYGIPEESATGMGAGPLACYLHDVVGIDKTTFVLEQGYLMDEPSPSLLTAELDIADGQITRVLVGGRGRVSREITLDLAS